MSRKTLLLCLVAVACFMTADAFWTERIDHAKKVVTDMIDAAIADFQHVVFKMKERAMEDMEDMRQRALDITQDIYDSISAAITKVIRQLDDRIAKLTEDANGVDISECRAMVGEIHNTALAIIANSSACVTDRIERGTGYVESITTIADEVLSNLTAIGHEATECTREVSGLEGTVKALGCLAVATKDAVFESTKRIPTVIVQITKLTALIGTIIPQLQYCTAKTSTLVIIEEANEIATTVEACVEEKINQFMDKGSTSYEPSSSSPTSRFTLPSRPTTSSTTAETAPPSTTAETAPTYSTPGTAPPSTSEKVQQPVASFEEGNDDLRP